MEFAGIITEYDPFHNGHAAQLAAVRQVGAKCIAVCMSSGAVQRGGVPILPDQVRARAALEAGADLVVALPAPYACATAEQFAAAGVFLLEALGCDTLAFGAETPDAAALMQAASLLCGTEIQTLIRQNLSTGQTYAAARAQAADTLSPGTGALLRTPNNILAIEYRYTAATAAMGGSAWRCPRGARRCANGQCRLSAGAHPGRMGALCTGCRNGIVSPGGCRRAAAGPAADGNSPPGLTAHHAGGKIGGYTRHQRRVGKSAGGSDS